LLFLGTIVGGLFAYISVALSARFLGAAEFGLLGALLGVLSLIGVAVRPGYLVATHWAASARTDGDVRALRGLAAAAVGFSAALAVGLLGGTWVGLDAIEQFFQTSTSGPFLALAIVIAATVCAQLLMGFVSGLHRFTTVALATISEPVARLIVVVPLVLILGVTGSLLSYFAGLLVTCGIAIKSLGGFERRLMSAHRLRGTWRLAGTSAALVFATALVQNLDLIILRSYAAADDVGFYAAAASLGNVLFALCAPLFLPAFPRTVSAHAEGKSTWPILRDVLVLVGAVCAIAIAGSAWLGTMLAEIMFGPAFGGVGTYLTVYLAKVSALIVLTAVGQYALAVGPDRAVYVSAAVAAIGPVIVVFAHPGPFTAAVIMLCSASAAAAVLAVLLITPRPGSGLSLHGR
jgi:O-antigen/teichoic acid export membrane protein